MRGGGKARGGTVSDTPVISLLVVQASLKDFPQYSGPEFQISGSYLMFPSLTASSSFCMTFSDLTST